MVLCSAGSYNSLTGSSNSSSCLKCPKNTFNILDGQPYCTPCGASAVSMGGTSACSCSGASRAYQTSDGSCLCKPGYEYFGIFAFSIVSPFVLLFYCNF